MSEKKRFIQEAWVRSLSDDPVLFEKAIAVLADRGYRPSDYQDCIFGRSVWVFRESLEDRIVVVWDEFYGLSLKSDTLVPAVESIVLELEHKLRE